MNVVLIVPTGIGAEIGGHAGDANPVAKLLASTCDKLITHPNVVNASDINEMTENTLYVEGSILDRFLEGEICLKEIHYNKILLVTNSPLKNEVINSVNAARTTIGADIEIEILKTPLIMKGYYEKKQAGGDVYGWMELVKQVIDKDCDALAITTSIEVDDDTKLDYLKNGGINPWGGVEAKASKLIANKLDKPVAHAPVAVEKDDILYNYKDVVDPRMSAEMVSISCLHCILKGLHKAPRISDKGLSVDNIDFLITPINCVGRPHRACMKAGIPIIAVRENKTCLNDKMPDNFIIVDNYLEAAGLLMAYKVGVNRDTIRRPLKGV